MDKKLVSVIIPVFNGERYISQAIESVLNQTYSSIEIIAIDDGSTDNTVEKLKRFGDRVFWKSIPNQGPANARNIGIKLAKGDYCAFLDHDDLWFKDKIKKQMQIFFKYPEVDFCCCNFISRRTDYKNRLMKHFSALKYQDLEFNIPCRNPSKFLIRENFIGTASNVIIKRKLIDEVRGFNPKYINSQEFELWLRCSLKAKFYILSDTLMYKRVHSENWSGNKLRSYSFQKNLTSDFIKTNFNFLKSHELLKIAHMTLAKKNYDLGNLYYEKGSVKEAYKLYWEGLKSRFSISNFLLFLSIVIRKSIRCISGNTIRRVS